MTRILLELPEPLENHYYGRVYREFPDLVSVGQIEAKVCEFILHDLEGYGGT